MLDHSRRLLGRLSPTFSRLLSRRALLSPGALLALPAPDRPAPIPRPEEVLSIPVCAQSEDDLACQDAQRRGLFLARQDRWDDLVQRLHHPQAHVTIGIVGKYVHLSDTYKSLNEALVHGGLANQVGVELRHIDSELVDPDDPAAVLSEVDAVLVPGGFGERGTEGKIAAIRYARENSVPFFGICLGMQLAVVEYARNVLGLAGAMSREFDPDPAHALVELMNEQRTVVDKGGTMRLGTYPCTLEDGSLARRVYAKADITERHRHRYEVNPAYHDQLRDGGLHISGMSPDGVLAEIVELAEHPWFLGCQFHPEFKSRPLEPHPLFSSYIKAVLTRKRATAVESRPAPRSGAGVEAQA